jgi:hypothetical protein
MNEYKLRIVGKYGTNTGHWLPEREALGVLAEVARIGAQVVFVFESERNQQPMHPDLAAVNAAVATRG